MVFRFVSANAHAQSLYGLQACIFRLKLPQALFYVSEKRKCSGETTLMRRIARYSAGRLCDKYLFSCVGLRSPGSQILGSNLRLRDLQNIFVAISKESDNISMKSNDLKARL